MATPGTPTREQLRIFLAVVDAGSFGAAARRLDRAVSVVSYGISNLEAQLGVDLFERQGTRKPRLTSAGRMVLAEARTLAQGIDGLRAKVKGLLDGLEAEIDLAVDVMLPAQRLATVLAAGVEGVEWTMAGSVPPVPVTAPGHPLARMGQIPAKRRATIASSCSPTAPASPRARISRC